MRLLGPLLCHLFIVRLFGISSIKALIEFLKLIFGVDAGVIFLLYVRNSMVTSPGSETLIFNDFVTTLIFLT